MAFSPEIVDFFPAGTYMKLPDRDGPTNAFPAEIIWLPHSPELTRQLEIRDFWRAETWDAEELKFGRSAGPHVEFLDSVNAHRTEADKIAILTRAHLGEVLYRQIWATVVRSWS
jgi:hypothetical protein